MSEATSHLVPKTANLTKEEESGEQFEDLNSDDVGEVEPGSEPGAGSEHYLSTVDAFEDFDVESDDDNTSLPNGDIVPKRRKRSGTIKKIKKQIRKCQSAEDPVKALRNSSLVDDTAGNSSSTNLSETDSDLDLNSQELVEQGAQGEHSASVSKSLERLKLSRADSVTSDSDPELEFVQSKEWKEKRKHVFVLSQSGKPIYSRYGNEEKLITTYGVMQALVSFIAHGGTQSDSLRMIVAADRRFVFLVKEHLILVAVSSGNESLRHLQLQLSYVYNQILSMLTITSLNKIFKERVNFDLRRMLAGTEKFLDNILTVMDNDTSYVLGSVRCLPLQSSVRDTITQTIVQSCNKVKDLVFAVLLSKNQLVAVVRMKNCALHPQDLHILLNLVQSSDSFKAAESWLPVCLPRFDSSGFLHAYIAYLDEPCNACLLLLTVDNQHFPILSECKTRIVERLNKYSCLQAIAQSVAADGYNTRQVGMPDLWHFIYKSRSTSQYTSPEITTPYVTEEQRCRLHSLYLNVHGRMHSNARPLRILYQTTQYESILGWVTKGFELYTVFSPLITKHSAISSVNKLLKWMKHEETRLFISSQTTF